ncbi:UDP-2,3-diacylglucosamine diphosphatase [Pseudomonas sp. N040]|uniref:UDP-2,3-diacylglucosamine diphosphatase n=1 Tax=Pseudomonas sp. N040 TaxID=2785325 RepID=UPI0018A32269|nr:UDP-2,3-diacylglucosamine diphosphatase [Pseudomonas sp. N040]MBF7730683.1 UDP-2,3-diacylglucosamine diphosphatase [Pseudomonas sp. N040]MBW7014326.1 UDP-2,3-diacylglucosamine diphosphatase [Pseudomonas sp. N040]
MSVLLISDLHLQEERPDVTRAFLDFLQTRAPGAEALYILGDFFEVWIGDDGMTPYQEGIAQALRQLADSGTKVYLMHGNRDFLLGKHFCRKAGCTLLPDPSLVQLGGESVLLMHGDTLCTRDVQYLRKRARIRSPLGLFILRHVMPLSRRQALARKLRQESLQKTALKAADIIDVSPEEIPRILHKYGVRKLIHGHTHRPAIHDLQVDGKPAQRIVLGDWDAQGWALQVDASGFALAPFPIKAG